MKFTQTLSLMINESYQSAQFKLQRYYQLVTLFKLLSNTVLHSNLKQVLNYQGYK